MTNLLKEQISFRQWDMTDETWLMARLKERAFFVAASEYGDDGEKGERRRPSDWAPKMLLKRGKALEQEVVLPDYTGNAKLARDKEKRYGRIVRGPCAVPGDGEGVDEAQRDDAFIADLSALEAERQRGEKSAEEDDEDEDDEDDGDYRESGSEAGSESGVKAIAPPRPTPAAAQTKKQVSDDDEQILLLCHERWQIPEILFRPEQLGGYSCQHPALSSFADSPRLITHARPQQHAPPPLAHPLRHRSRRQRRRSRARSDALQRLPHRRPLLPTRAAPSYRSRLASHCTHRVPRPRPDPWRISGHGWRKAMLCQVPAGQDDEQGAMGCRG